MNENQKPTTKTRIYNLIVLDKSGSMGCIRHAAFSGCNEVLGGIKAEEVCRHAGAFRFADAV